MNFRDISLVIRRMASFAPSYTQSHLSPCIFTYSQIINQAICTLVII